VELSILLAAGFLVAGASERTLTFSLPDSILLFGHYNDLRVVTLTGEQSLRPPVNVGYNSGYFASPSISPRGDAIAWGFAVEWQEEVPGLRLWRARTASNSSSFWMSRKGIGPLRLTRLVVCA
jgi:hypothetical protein